MRVAVLSDIHANLEALGKVLQDLDRRHLDLVISLGDLVGYGPDPLEVVRLVRKRRIPSVMGNHEFGLVDPRFLKWFNKSTRESLKLTKKLLSPETLTYFQGLKPFLLVGDCRFVHGCPPDSITTYLFEYSNLGLKELFGRMKERMAFVGHTHDLILIAFDGSRVFSEPLGEGKHLLKKNWRYLINVGSVGQPRDGNNKAKYVIWDDDAQTLEVRFLPYDMARTAEKIITLGFPESNARRLW
jgi:predicted phosphodiesterase